jgi:hypothetical protein
MVDVTSRLLGDAYAGTLRGWRDTYESFLAVYADASIRRTEKLNRFNQLFRAMFIDRHPAYPLYRHWYDLTDAAPEFPAPPTNEPTPRITEGEDVSESEYRGSRYADSSDEAFPVRLRLSPRVLLMIVGGIMFLLVFAALGGLLNSGSPPEIAVTITETSTPNLTASQAALALQSVPATATPAPRDTLDPARVTLTLPAGDFVTPTLRPSVTALVDAVVSPLPVSSPTPTLTSTPSLTFTPSITPTPTNTPTPTASPSATLPPLGLQGEQDLLALFNATSGFTWNSEQFSLVSAIDSTYWRLGSNEVSDEALIRIALPASILESSFGNNAATRIRRMEVEMTLTTFNPALIGSSDVYFGALLQAGEDGAQSAGLQIQLLEPGVISLAQQAGAQTTTVSQRAVSVYVARLRLDRDLTNGSISVFFNGELIGTPISFVDADAALLPVLYVRNGGVIVSVTRWSVTLR